MILLIFAEKEPMLTMKTSMAPMETDFHLFALRVHGLWRGQGEDTYKEYNS